MAASENMKALRAAFKERLGEVKKKARRMRAESLLSDDDEGDDGYEEKETIDKVSKKGNAPDLDSPLKEEPESKAEKRSELRDEITNFMSKPRKIETGKTKVIVAVGPKKTKSVFRKMDEGDKKKGKK